MYEQIVPSEAGPQLSVKTTTCMVATWRPDCGPFTSNPISRPAASHMAGRIPRYVFLTAETESHGRFVSPGKTHDVARQTHYPNGVRVHV